MSRHHDDVKWSSVTKKIRAAYQRRLDAGEVMQCSVCNGAVTSETAFDLDHLVPLAVDPEGASDPDNLAVAHRSCNRREGQRLGQAAIRAKKNRDEEASVFKSTSRQSRRPSSDIVPQWGQKALTETVTRPPLVGGTGAVVPRYWPRTLSSEPREPGERDRPPRVFSEPHPRAVGTLVDKWAPRLEELEGSPLRHFQWLVLARGLEVDADGRLVWERCVVTMSRQMGKSRVAGMLALGRAEFAADFDEPQRTIMVTNNLATSRALQARHWKHYLDLKKAGTGHNVYQRNGSEQIVWPDDSAWVIVSRYSIHGNTASLAIIDECWDLAVETVTSALGPTLAERDQGQLWALSTANLDCTPLLPDLRQQALNPRDPGSPDVALMEWSMDPSEDPMDPAVWEASSAYWTERRHKLIAMDAASSPTAHLATEWLCRWPDVATRGMSSAAARRLEGISADAWSALAVDVLPPPASRVLVIVEEAKHGRGLTAGRFYLDDAGVLVLTAMSSAVETVDAALDWAMAQGGWDVLGAGISLIPLMPRGVECVPFGVKETRAHTGAFLRLVAAGGVAHSGDTHLAGQTAGLWIEEAPDGSASLNARRSEGEVSAIKMSIWAASAFAQLPEGPMQVRKAAIW